MSPMLHIALKEWQGVCTAITTGRQCVLLRKGGVHEVEGKFELEQSKFLLFPTWLHQNIDWIKPADRSLADARDAEPGEIALPGWAEVVDIWQVQSREQINSLDAGHIYLPPLIDMRFSYKPHNPLYLMVLRGYRFENSPVVANTPAYAGCRSWVPLETPIDVSSAAPAMSEEEFEVRRDAIARAF